MAGGQSAIGYILPSTAESRRICRGADGGEVTGNPLSPGRMRNPVKDVRFSLVFSWLFVGFDRQLFFEPGQVESVNVVVV